MSIPSKSLIHPAKADQHHAVSINELPKWISIPFLIGAIIVTTVVFSALFTLLLIPLSYANFKVWYGHHTHQPKPIVDLVAHHSVVSKQNH